MHTTLELRASGTQLEANLARRDTLTKLRHALHADILEGVLHTDVQVRQERLDAALVLHITADTLRDLDHAALGEVARRRRVLEGGVVLGRRVLARRGLANVVDLCVAAGRLVLLHRL